MAISVTTKNETITATVTDEKVSASVSQASPVSATVTAGFGASGPAGSQGPQGDVGPAGPTGDTGPAGSAATVSVGTVTTGAAGSSASVTNVGTNSAAVLNFSIPAGATGSTGATGPAGSSGVISVAAPITNSGTSSSASLGISVGAGLAVSGGTLVVSGLGISDISGLQTAIDGKAASTHTHAVGDLAQSGATTDQVVAWSGSAWAPATLATVATSGSYNDLADQPTIPEPFVLEYATDTILGGIKVGTGLGVTGPIGSLYVVYGGSSGQACQGNDSRLSNSREWTASTVTQAEAEAGTATTRRAWTAQRVFQAVAAWWAASSAKTKLDGIATGATANATDAQLRDRSTHTGTQAWTTITSTPTSLSGYGINDAASSTHTHGNITNAGAIGATSGQIVVTTTSGVLTTAASISSSVVSGLGGAATLNVGTTAGTVAAGDHTHTQLHDRSHAITSSSDHTATAWRVFYSNDSGVVTELAFGASGKVLQSNGASSAPTWETVTGGGTTTTNAGDLVSGTLSDARLSSKAQSAINLYLWSNFR